MDWNIRGNPRVAASMTPKEILRTSRRRICYAGTSHQWTAHSRKSARNCLDDSKENSPDITPANLSRRNFASRGMEWRGVAQPLQGAPISVHFAPVDFVGSTHPTRPSSNTWAVLRHPKPWQTSRALPNTQSQLSDTSKDCLPRNIGRLPRARPNTRLDHCSSPFSTLRTPCTDQVEALTGKSSIIGPKFQQIYNST